MACVKFVKWLAGMVRMVQLLKVDLGGKVGRGGQAEMGKKGVH